MAGAQLIGRGNELAVAADRLRSAVDGVGQVILLAGEPGIGKTRLAQEITELAADAGLATSWGRAAEDEGSPPYWPFRQVLRELVRQRDPGPLARDLALIVPEVGASQPVITPDERFRVFEAVTEYLAAWKGLLIVLDDLQWADPPTLQLLVHLARAARSMRLLIVATYRDTEVRGREGLSAMLASLAHEVTRIRLVGLTKDEVGAQLAELTGRPADDDLIAQVSRRTQGNPFFVTELGRLVPDSSTQLPDGVRDAVRARLRSLSPLCRDVVTAGAALGSGVDASTLAAVVDRPIDDVLSALDEAGNAGVLSGSRFSHDLVRDAARLELPTIVRLGIHRKVAELYESRVDASAHAAEIAHHWLESLPAGDAGKAAEWAERAADTAMSQLAWESANVLYGRALTASPNLPQATRSRLLCQQGTARLRLFDVAGSVQNFQLAAQAARDAKDTNALVNVALAAETVSTADWVSSGKALCDEALALLPEADNPLRARLLAQRAREAAWFASPAADELSGNALAMADRTGDPLALRSALRARQIARSTPDGVRERLELGNQMLAIGVADDDPEAVMWGRLWRFDAFCQLGRLDDAEAELLPIGEVVARVRTPEARWHHLRSQVAIAHAHGEFARARELADAAYELMRPAGADSTVVRISTTMLANVAAMTGDEQEIIDRHQDYLLNPPAITAPMLASWYLAECGRPDLARRWYQPKLVDEPLNGPRWMQVVAGLCWLAAAFDDRETAAAAYRRLLPYQELLVCGGAGVGSIHGSVHESLAAAAAATGQLDVAVKHARQAIETDDRVGLRPYSAKARLQLAQLLARRRRPGDEAEAAAMAKSAAALGTELGMKRLVADAQTVSGDAPGPLSKREYEIAKLVSQGLTNKQIAAAAHISVRTVETHVQNIMTKLGVSSRTQIGVS